MKIDGLEKVKDYIEHIGRQIFLAEESIPEPEIYEYDLLSVRILRLRHGFVVGIEVELFYRKIKVDKQIYWDFYDYNFVEKSEWE
jgi:hypothetical protein